MHRSIEGSKVFEEAERGVARQAGPHRRSAVVRAGVATCTAVREQVRADGEEEERRSRFQVPVQSRAHWSSAGFPVLRFCEGVEHVRDLGTQVPWRRPSHV